MSKSKSPTVVGPTPTEPVHEPKADWVPLEDAPFYCFPEGWAHSCEAWGDALRIEVRRIISVHEELRRHASELSEPERHMLFGRDVEFAMRTAPEWSFINRRTRAGEYLAIIKAMGMTTDIAPGGVFVHGSAETFEDDGHWMIGSPSNEILQSPDWEKKEIPPADRAGVQWHRWLLEHLFSTWESNFRAAFRSGAVRIMARKGSVLAPFERVTPDQWQWFRLDDEDALSKPRNPVIWHDPARRYARGSMAIGPTGERVYSIYVAPAPNKLIRPVDPEEKCLQWVLELLRQYPDRQPMPLSKLAKEAASKFDGVSERDFYKCYSYAQSQTGNRSWSLPGALPKSPQKSPQKN